MMIRILRVALPLLVLGAGIAILGVLVNTRPEAEKRETSDPGALVEIVEVQAERERVKVEAHGTVVPSRQVVLSPEVSGKVVWVNAEIKPGSKFDEGELLVRIDPREYRLAVEQQLAQVDRALTELKIEKGRKKIAEREWDMFEEKEPPSEPKDEEGSALALREPQLKTAKASLEAAKSGLEKAKLAVSKTRIEAPFNAMVKQEQVELGQMVGPSAQLLNLVGTDDYWVQVSIPVDRLGWIDVPGVAAAEQGSSARIVQEIGEGRYVERSGRVIRLLGDVDPAGRMARVLIEIDDPLALQAPAAAPEQKDGASRLPLLLGSFVEVEIDGREVDGVVVIPREALREGDQVYLMSDDSTLEKREVSVVWRRPKTVLVDQGLEDGDRLVVSPVPTPVEGMKLRTADQLEAGAGDQPEKAARAEP